MPSPRVSERTFYPPLMHFISLKGGESVSEVQFNSVPDIVFDLGEHKWLLSVKIGESPAIIKAAFLQYLRHKEESDITFGMLLLLPESMRRVKTAESALVTALGLTNVTALIDAGNVKEELRDRPFPAVLDFLFSEVLFKLRSQQTAYYSLALVISLLQQQVAEMMNQINMEEGKLLSIITDKHLLSDLGHLSRKHTEAVGRFLGSYIFLSQVLFLRLFASTNPHHISIRKPANHDNLHHAFKQISDINYRPIYKFDVLDTLDDKYLADTFDLLWGLEVERIRYELPGRIFHELMPHEIRKMLASFYTRPIAADLLAQLCVSESTQTVFDPACGSGTILTAAYKQKLGLWHAEGKSGNPHRRFCHRDIYGADIMPFAVHLTSANLAAMDPSTIIDRTQIIQGDSIRLQQSTYTANIDGHLFPQMAHAHTVHENLYDVDLVPVDIVMMNPPFTKVERGIRHFVDMETFRPRCGGEVGLWGHFIILADSFLRQNGFFAGVIPINVLRGRESSKVRRFLFQEWTTLYVLKPTLNYGFSEWSEYRDVIFIARKQPPPEAHKVKFCLIKKDLTKTTAADILHISQTIKEESQTRGDPLVDIDIHNISEITQRLDNTMWFCSMTDFGSRDTMLSFVKTLSGKLSEISQSSATVKTGYRPDAGHSKFLFFTRHTSDARIEEAFLRFSEESPSTIQTTSPLGASYSIPKTHLAPSLRTPVGVRTMDISTTHDYICTNRYPSVDRICRAADVTCPPSRFWASLEPTVDSLASHLVFSCRLNPFSPANHLIAFHSTSPVSPADQLNVIQIDDTATAQALCVIMNSIVFLSQFFLQKEESTGRYLHIRVYDLDPLLLVPAQELIPSLANVYEAFRDQEFESLRDQFDQNFDRRYDEFWAKHRGDSQLRFFSVVDKSVKPLPTRLNFDLAVCKALGLNASRDQLVRLYGILVNEMIITKGLARD